MANNLGYRPRQNQGRPWEFDRGAIYDGRKRTSTFRMGNRELVLFPSKDEILAKSSKREGRNFLTSVCKRMRSETEVIIGRS
ncbi:unnamed protein product [Dovyalis caffra]|uniref:Uncharacterized protein n=1 Tax=Dovyalis caffra TaxID=77055 RepID=A0AAV1RJY3_9ROSI|nr:unnamed protein product [Dovyalis caffra]